MCVLRKEVKWVLSCPHFIFFPKRGGVRPHYFLLRSLAGMCMTLVGKRVVDLFWRQDKLAVCIFRCSCCIYLSI